MPDLPARPDLHQLRRLAKDLLQAATTGDATALARIHAACDRVTLAGAQLALAREYGFAGWATLRAEVERREILDDRDLDQLVALLARDPGQAVAEMQHWRDHPLGAAPLNYLAMLRYDTARHGWRDVPDTAAVARALLAAGAPVDGRPGESETPLMTAASYGDAEVARVLVEAGADLEARAAPDAGGVPGGTALLHAAVFGMTAVVDVLVAAGARVDDLVLAAAAGDLSGRDVAGAEAGTRLLALIMAADHQRVPVIDQLVAAGTPVDAVDPGWGRQPLRLAAENGRPAGVRSLLGHGADPRLRDGEGRTALDLCRVALAAHPDSAGHLEVMALLEPRAEPR